MNARTVGLLVFLTLIKNSCETIPFELKTPLTAVEGTCIEIKCKVTRSFNVLADSNWFWLKNAKYEGKDFTGTVVYSKDRKKRPVSSDYAGRVNFTGPELTLEVSKSCGILICNLNKSDSGNYSFRFVGHDAKNIWITDPGANLTVIDNPCPITFEKPPVVNESSKITLKCSTQSSCQSKLKLKGYPGESSESEQIAESIEKRLEVTWQDDGREISCQTVDNEDEHLIRKISLTVTYAPKNTKATLTSVDSQRITEGQSVTLTCSAKGRPDPTFTWFKNKEKIEEAELKFTSITAAENGTYYCVAVNMHGTSESDPVFINVTYAPEVEVKTSSALKVPEGESMTLTCSVKRSNPPPHTFVWFKNNTRIRLNQTYVVQSVGPKDSGFYTCEATNSVRSGKSAAHIIIVEFSPRSTRISMSVNEVKVGESLTFTCDTEAYPSPSSYIWDCYKKNKQIGSPQCRSFENIGKSLHLENVQRSDEACYMCNATNSRGPGDNSDPKCIQVLYPPTIPTLSMDTLVSEGQTTTINCTVESSPLSDLILTRTNDTNPQSAQNDFINYNHLNNLQHKFDATSTDSGFYTCKAKNRIGENKSVRKELVVKYCPKDVTVQATPDVVVRENKSLTLQCSARSYPAVTSYTWKKIIEGKSESIGTTQTFTVKSVSPSDSGLYTCTASNEMGTGKSQEAEIKVKYAPKHTNIKRGTEQQQPDGTKSVMLSCSSHCYPPVTHFTWFKKTEVGDEKDKKVSDLQSFTVHSDNPGVYYCVAKNEINWKSSDPVEVFVDRGLVKTLIIICVLIMLIFIVCFFVYRHKRNKTIQQRTTSTPYSGSLIWGNVARRRNVVNAPGMAEPSRSRDDLLPDQPFRPEGQRRQQQQLRPDSTPASNINSVYCTVNLPTREQGPSGERTNKQQAGHTQNESLNYASLHFEEKEKRKQAKPVEDVYSMVSKQKLPKKDEPENLRDYENLSLFIAGKCPDSLSSDTETSEDEVELQYSKVSFKANPGHQQAESDSSTSDEDETQYSQVKT
uniref:B-cell receptor CD22 n=1 Tax=Semicossyphus pulcher TaxID=241346 RepID=UPI0037E8DD0E